MRIVVELVHTYTEKTYDKFIRSFWRQIMTDEVAKAYSWRGTDIKKCVRGFLTTLSICPKYKCLELWNVRAVLFWLALVNIAASYDEIGIHIRKCCENGIQSAVTQNKCEKYVHEFVPIPSLWHALCHSANGACCSRKMEEQHCVLGRLAATRGSICDEVRYSSSYILCCRVCQVGLGVKDSNSGCSNSSFAYFNQMETYQICCDGGNNDSSRIIPFYGTTDVKANRTLNSEANIYWNASKVQIPSQGVKLFSNASHDPVLQLGVDDAQPHNDEEKKAAAYSSNDPKNGKNFAPLQCTQGYKFDNRHGRCVDVDECTTNVHVCQNSQYCHNTAGSYHCLNVHAKICEPEKEKCQNQCSIGFQYTNDGCVDIDECAQDSYACDSNQVCSNDIGGYRCDCKIGFNLDTIMNACIDINECSINNHNCLPTQRCDNTYGSYVCIRLQSCGTGYTLNAETGNCDDDDECILGTHNCPNGYNCHNTKGSFRCHRRMLSLAKTPETQLMSTDLPATTPFAVLSNTVPYNKNRFVPHQRYSLNQLKESTAHLPCEIGFHRNHLDLCVDMDECIQDNSCGSQQRCVNSNGSYRCLNLLQCSTGYQSTSDGAQCIDIDECKTGEHQCLYNQICRNRNGGYICSCLQGYQLLRHDNGTDRCVDLNECQQQRQRPVCPTNSKCVNSIGSYYCECATGFRKGNGVICLDVDECDEMPSLCHQKCVNYWGGYRCACNEGFEINKDNLTCNDINECEVHKPYTLCMGYCDNVSGSYECSCPRGYTIGVDKNTCSDIDECASGEFCTGHNDICTNIHGSYKCTTVHCKYGYINDLDQKNRCRLTSNFCEGKSCYNKPSAYTYNFITLVSKLGIPPKGRIIFGLRGPMWYDSIDFDWKIVKIQAAENIEEATEQHFETINAKDEVHLKLKRSLEGPQEIEIEINMTVFTKGMPRGKSVAKLFVLVSQHTF